jgi:hypothetical protein
MRKVVAFGVGTALVVACLSPTEIDVAVRTDVPCSSVTGTLIYGSGQLLADASADAAPAGASTYCDATGYLGTLVFVPSGIKSGPLDVEVVTGVNGTAPEDCAATGFVGCIVARRQWAFQPHQPVHATVQMFAACIGVACDPSTTCEMGACVPIAAASCGFDTCTGDAEAVDAAEEGGHDAAADGGAHEGGAADGGLRDAAAADATRSDSTAPADSQGQDVQDAPAERGAMPDAADAADAGDATVHDTGAGVDSGAVSDAGPDDADGAAADAPVQDSSVALESDAAMDAEDAPPADAPLADAEDAPAAETAAPEAGDGAALDGGTAEAGAEGGDE